MDSCKFKARRGMFDFLLLWTARPLQYPTAQFLAAENKHGRSMG